MDDAHRLASGGAPAGTVVITEMGDGYPGYSGQIPKSAAMMTITIVPIPPPITGSPNPPPRRSSTFELLRWSSSRIAIPASGGRKCKCEADQNGSRAR